MEQPIVAGLQMYDITKESWYLQMADETINFFMNYFVDNENGEIYADRTRYGGFAWNEAKGNSGKAGYHSIETGYYTYLYGNLFYTNQPVTLHYNFYPLPTEREMLLTPLAIKDTNLIIAQVMHDGQFYANYDPVNRILTLPAGVGGQFEVTYNTLITNIVADATVTVDDFELSQNYPNPFNPVTTIRYKIPDQSFATLKVFDLLGREISTLVNEEKSAGNYEVKFNASSLPSGIYFYRLQSANFDKIKKMILMK
jgi:hypothetical protein